MLHPSEKRHLPVVKMPESDLGSAQSPWLWVLYASMVIVLLWVPLALLSLVAGSKISSLIAGNGMLSTPPSPAFVLPTASLVLLSFGVACAAGGAMLSRFSERARPWDAALSGACAVIWILVFAALGNALRPAPFGVSVAISLFAVGPALAAFGGRVGRRRVGPYDPGSM
jgi:hypothetical protein